MNLELILKVFLSTRNYWFKHYKYYFKICTNLKFQNG